MFIDTTSDVASRVTGAIREAARLTGAGFEYLLKTAQRESNLDPTVKATTSSATGLFQFIDQTWLGTLKNSGASLGYGQYADAITKTPSGRYVVSDPASYREIMKLRTDPTANAVMAGAFTAHNASELTEGLGRKPTDGELYIAHFLGPAGAVRFIGAAEKTPNAPAAKLFPEAARANRSIFYNRVGAPKPFAQVYQNLVSGHGTVAPVPATKAVDPVVATNTQKIVTQASATQPVAPMQTGPVFHELFRTGNRGPVSPVVGELWGVKPAGASTNVQLASAVAPVKAATSTAQAQVRAGAPLDLFQFLRPEIRGLITPSA